MNAAYASPLRWMAIGVAFVTASWSWIAAAGDFVPYATVQMTDQPSFEPFPFAFPELPPEEPWMCCGGAYQDEFENNLREARELAAGMWEVGNQDEYSLAGPRDLLRPQMRPDSDDSAHLYLTVAMLGSVVAVVVSRRALAAYN